MKKLNILWIILPILVIIIFTIMCASHFRMEKTEKTQLQKANEIINSEGQNQLEMVTDEELKLNDNIIGILEIPKLDLVAPIQEGTSQETLKEAIGHFSESSFWNGNVAFASHNRSRYVHYFEKIDELQSGDEIIYKTKLGERKYTVYESKIIDSSDWSVIGNTNDNIVTLITCIQNRPKSRLCVRARENIN